VSKKTLHRAIILIVAIGGVLIIQSLLFLVPLLFWDDVG